VGAFQDDNANGINAGSSFVFSKPSSSSSTCTQMAQLLAARQGPAGDLFGFSVSISKDELQLR
jgi:hypothetical protein